MPVPRLCCIMNVKSKMQIISKISPWSVMFTDSIIICSESREPAGEGLERPRHVQEEREIKCSSSRSKAEHVCE